MKALDHTIIRDVAVPPAAAFAWLTDWREDDARWVFDDKRATRSVERRDAQTVHLVSVAKVAGLRNTTDLVVRLTPPNSWRGDGEVRLFGLRMLNQSVEWRVEPNANGGTRFTAKFRFTPANAAASAILPVMGFNIRRALDQSYDRIAKALASDAKAATPASSSAGRHAGSPTAPVGP